MDNNSRDLLTLPHSYSHHHLVVLCWTARFCTRSVDTRTLLCVAQTPRTAPPTPGASAGRRCSVPSRPPSEQSSVIDDCEPRTSGAADRRPSAAVSRRQPPSAGQARRPAAGGHAGPPAAAAERAGACCGNLPRRLSSGCGDGGSWYAARTACRPDTTATDGGPADPGPDRHPPLRPSSAGYMV